MKINTFTLFDHLSTDEVLSSLNDAHKGSNQEEAYYSLIRLLVNKKQSLYEYIVTQMLNSTNRKLIALESPNELDIFTKSCLEHDFEIFLSIFTIDLSSLSRNVGDSKNLLSTLEEYPLSSQNDTYTNIVLPYINLFIEARKHSADLSYYIDEFMRLLKTTGVGPYALYPAFYVNQTAPLKLEGVENINGVKWEHIYFYDWQKNDLLKNTINFINEVPFQNVLLVGASGTGKSSCVKAVVQRFSSEKLRLIQMQKGQLHLLPKLMKEIDHREFKFILFIDDLSFEANEDEYKFLKSFIEGSIASENNQVAFYVTSNRRHLIKEIRTERENDIHLNDFIQEMTSLSDRFGMTLSFEGLVQDEYYDMVIKMIQDINDQNDNSNPIDIDDIKNQARIYALRHGKMSGRVAMQFVRSLGLT